MRILFVCSGNHNQLSPFIQEQADAVTKLGVVVDFYLIEGKGIFGYLSNYKLLRRKILEINPDIVHAHFGLSGFLSCLQRIKPVVVTFHGSDINVRRNRQFSRVAYLLAKKSIFVTESMARVINVRVPIVIPCGVDIDTFFPIPQSDAKGSLGMDKDKQYILFPSRKENLIKNYLLAKEAFDLIDGKTELIELVGYSRNQVNLLLNAVDCLIMTSFSEGSPQTIKEAMACNCPIVSTNVGDVAKQIEGVSNTFICDFNPHEIADALTTVLRNHKRTNGRQRIIQNGLTLETIGEKVIGVYKSVTNH